MSDPKRLLDDRGVEDQDILRLVRLGKTLGPRPGSAERAWTEFLAISGGFPPDPSGGGGAEGGALPDPAGASGALGGGAAGTASAVTTTSASLTGASLVKTLLLGAALGTGGVLATEVVTRSSDTPAASVAPTPVDLGAPEPLVPVSAQEPPGAPSLPVPTAEPAAAAATSASATSAPSVAPAFAANRPAPAATGVVSFPSETGITSFPLDADRASLLQREAREVAEAKALLAGGQARDALALLHASAQRFPQGTLGQEREALGIEALAKSGDAPAARARAKAFLARFPKSPLVERVRRFAGE